nr:parathymosin isoform X1 [Microcebus murinus]
MSEKSVEAAAELSAKDLKEKKEKVEEKASRKERKKEVVEVWRGQAGEDPTCPSSFPSSYLPGGQALPSPAPCPSGCSTLGPSQVLWWCCQELQPEALPLLVPTGGGEWS